MAVRKHNGSWWVDFMYNYERMRKRSPHNSKGSAEAFEVYLRQLVGQHGSVEKAKTAMEAKPEAQVQTPTLTEFSERWLRYYVDVNNKPSERYSKRLVLRRTLLPAFGTRRLDDIGAKDIAFFKHAEQERGLSHKTINNSLAILSTCLKTAAEWEVIKDAPRVKFLKLPPLKTSVVSPENSARLLAACPPIPWRPFVLTALRTGLRFNELIALEWPDIDFDAAILTVRRGEWRGHVGTTKTGESRLIPLTSEVVEALRTLPRCHERVFTNQGRAIKYDTAHWNLTRICRRAGIPHTSWHPLRHTFATNLNAASGNIKHIQELLGHKTLTMTLRYTHPVTDALRRTIALLEPKRVAEEFVTPLSPVTS